MVAGVKETKQGGVVAFCSTGVENYLGVVAVEELCHGLTGTIQSSAGRLAVQMNRRRVAEVFLPEWAHCLHHLWEKRSSGIRIHVYAVGRLILRKHDGKAPIFEGNISVPFDPTTQNLMRPARTVPARER